MKQNDEHIQVQKEASSLPSLYVVKIGGNIIDDDTKLAAFLKAFASIKEHKILVHGGGKLATRVAEGMGIGQKLVDGRRITDSETLKVVTMVYAGYINKNIVALLQGFGCNAMGLSGADGNLIRAHKRTGTQTDYGFVGDVDAVNAPFLYKLITSGVTPVLSPITHDAKGQLLNTNADTIAQETARSLSTFFKVSLIYSFEKSGVLLDANDDTSVIPSLNRQSYQDLKDRKVIFEGMIPKLDNAFSALQQGVHEVIIGKAEQLVQLISRKAGTIIIND